MSILVVLYLYLVLLILIQSDTIGIGIDTNTGIGNDPPFKIDKVKYSQVVAFYSVKKEEKKH